MILWFWFIVWAGENCPHIDHWNWWSITLCVCMFLQSLVNKASK